MDGDRDRMRWGPHGGGNGEQRCQGFLLAAIEILTTHFLTPVLVIFLEYPLHSEALSHAPCLLPFHQVASLRFYKRTMGVGLGKRLST